MLKCICSVPTGIKYVWEPPAPWTTYERGSGMPDFAKYIRNTLIIIALSSLLIYAGFEVWNGVSWIDKVLVANTFLYAIFTMVFCKQFETTQSQQEFNQNIGDALLRSERVVRTAMITVMIGSGFVWLVAALNATLLGADSHSSTMLNSFIACLIWILLLAVLHGSHAALCKQIRERKLVLARETP